MDNKETEPDLNAISYEKIPLPGSTEKRIKRNFKPMRGLWTFDIKRSNLKSGKYIVKITSVIKKYPTYAIDFLNHMRYSLKQTNKRKDKNAMSKTTQEKTVKNPEIKVSFSWKKFGNGIMGVGQLFVAASIIASTVIIWNGTEGITPKIIVTPMAIYAIIILVSKFISNNKGNK